MEEERGSVKAGSGQSRLLRQEALQLLLLSWRTRRESALNTRVEISSWSRGNTNIWMNETPETIRPRRKMFDWFPVQICQTFKKRLIKDEVQIKLLKNRLKTSKKMRK